jgi:hypothetical protein
VALHVERQEDGILISYGSCFAEKGMKSELHVVAESYKEKLML